jgi:hypothetical protein
MLKVFVITIPIFYLFFASSDIFCTITIQNDTRNPVKVALLRTIFTIGDRHNKMYWDGQGRHEAINKTDIYTIPPGKNINVPSLGSQNMFTYDCNVWASYSSDNLARAIIEPQGRTPYKHTVFCYNIGSGIHPIHIVEKNSSQLSFILEAPSNKAKLNELKELVGRHYKDIQPSRDSLENINQIPKKIPKIHLSPEENAALTKKFNRIMRLLAVPFRM